MFPHPDDEAITCGGTLRLFSDRGASVTLVLLTGGERGNPAGVVDDALKATRRREAEQVARILGLSRLIPEDFPDAGLNDARDQMREYLASLMHELKPGLLISYDQSGMDGHPDHVACAEVVTELRRRQFPEVQQWDVALPAYLLRVLQLAGQLRQSEWLAARRVRPTHAVFLGGATLAKMRAVRAYRSQRVAIGKGLGRYLPSWLMMGLLPVEYFAAVD